MENHGPATYPIEGKQLSPQQSNFDNCWLNIRRINI